MKNFCMYYFEMFDQLLGSDYAGITSGEFHRNVIEVAEKIKDTFILNPNYNSICLKIDKYFDEYLESR